MDPPKATFVSLAAMTEWLQPFPGTATAWRAEVPRGGCRLADRILAHVQDIRRSKRPCAIRISTASVFCASMFLLKLNSIEPPWYGPVCPVVWEGRRREASPLSRSVTPSGLLIGWRAALAHAAVAVF